MLDYAYDLFSKLRNKISYKSEKGKKPSQEDSFYVSPPKNRRRLIIVADGVGGHGNGDFASSLCVSIFSNEFLTLPKDYDPVRFLEETAMLTGERILEKSSVDPSYKNCGTTLSGFLVFRDTYYTINIGDSRVYLFRNGTLKQITEDHSVVRSLLESGQITAEEALRHPSRHIMTSALGQPLEQMTISIKGPQPLLKNDILVACTDGIHEFLDNSLFAEIMSDTPAKSLSDVLVYTALKNGSKDNLTCCTLKY